MRLPANIFRRVLGAFRILRRRAVEVERPGLAIWADAGERAALKVATNVRTTAHQAETGADEMGRELHELLADGKITRAELARLRKLERQARRVAGECHDITEAVQP